MTAFTVDALEEFFNLNNRFVQDDHNMDLLTKYFQHMGRNRRDLTIEGLAEFIRKNSASFHWLRSQAEIDSAVAAAKPKEAPKPKLKGLTMAEKLAQVGVQASHHLSHADKNSNDAKSDSLISQIGKAAAQTQRDIERKARIDEARSIVVYAPGPGGRVNHAATESARKAALARLGVTE